MHVYHYAPYEPAALKRLMGRYATREAEVDRMLRAGLFVDLYAVVKHAVRASVERYSIKDLEPFYTFTREVNLADARTHLRVVERAGGRGHRLRIVVDAAHRRDARTRIAQSRCTSRETPTTFAKSTLDPAYSPRWPCTDDFMPPPAGRPLSSGT